MGNFLPKAASLGAQIGGIAGPDIKRKVQQVGHDADHNSPPQQPQNTAGQQGAHAVAACHKYHKGNKMHRLHPQVASAAAAHILAANHNAAPHPHDAVGHNGSRHNAGNAKRREECKA